jgi:hypothetical protein
MSNSQRMTTADHREIRAWVEERDATPASARGAETEFAGAADLDVLEHLSWHDWFDKVERSQRAFLYQRQKAGGENSAFFMLVARD